MKRAETALLVLRGVSKHFGGLAALSDISLQVREGEIYGLIGPNGAGKTTLFNVLTGIYAPDAGDFFLGAIRLNGFKPHRIAASGFSRTFQNIRLFANMTALENVMVGRHIRSSAGVIGAILQTQRTRDEEADIARRAIKILEYVGIASRAHDLARNLSYGEQRRLEIARALAAEPRLLALDEPAAGMNATETAALKSLLERIRRDGTTLLLIEHDVKLVMGLCDRVAVLDYGEKIAEDVPEAVRANTKVIEAYLGTSAH